MVGTVVFKNFETGSYKYMRIAVYNGSSYSDIGKGEFISLRVDPDEKSIDCDFRSSEDAPRPGMRDVLLAAEKAREYLYENPHITSAEYCLNLGECVLRPLSYKSGVYEPPDFQSLFNDGGFFALAAEFKDKTPMWRSVLCEGIDFSVRRTFGISEGIFSCSGYGIYINLAVFPKNVYDVFGLPPSLRKTACSKKAFKVNLNRFQSRVLSAGAEPVSHPAGRIIYLLSAFKIKCLNRLAELMKNVTSSKTAAQCIHSLPTDEYIIKLTDDFTEELRSFSLSRFDYGYLSARSHADMLTLRETLLISGDTELSEKAAQIARARSVNTKFTGKLPCVPFYDSDGRAIWE